MLRKIYLKPISDSLDHCGSREARNTVFQLGLAKDAQFGIHAHPKNQSRDGHTHGYCDYETVFEILRRDKIGLYAWRRTQSGTV